jgi:hypoxanthine-DNA glycosylase
MTKLETGFPEIADKQAQILILGSMPSVQSLKQQQYYAHPRNAFWPIMTVLCDMDKECNYQQRCEHLKTNYVAVWDVLKACHRQGSLDTNIDPSSMIANDFNSFFQQHPKIKYLFFNGAKAQQIFKRYVVPNLDTSFKQLNQTRLPSTSPAHAAMKLEQKLKLWKTMISKARSISVIN